MSRLLLLAACLLLLGAASAAAQAAPPAEAAPARRPPNVLFLAIDDLRPELGCYGAGAVRTPHIDALAADGVTFLRHYVEVPTCGASRYALLTGRSARSSGARRGNAHFYQGPTALAPQALEGAQTFPELFRRSGYRTELIGKLSHTPDGRVYAYDGSGDGRPELPHAWDHYATPYGAWKRGWGSFFAYADGLHREDGGGHRDLMQFTAENDDDLPDGQMAAAAERRLAALAATEEPFFLAVGFFKPHLPFVATRADWEAVQDWPVPAPQHEGLADSPYATTSGEFYGYSFPFEKTRPLDEASTRTARLAYLACVRYVDRQVGRVLAALDAHGLAENTVVVLWSDHGWYLGEDGMWGKHTPLERAMHSPLIVRAPGVSVPGHRTTALASSLDVYPTLVELCAPDFRRTAHPLDGVSLAPLLRGEDVALRDAVEGWWGKVRTVRTESGRTFQ